MGIPKKKYENMSMLPGIIAHYFLEIPAIEIQNQ